MRRASRDALLRVARAQPNEWCIALVADDNAARNLAGHLEDWSERIDTFGIEARERMLNAIERDALRKRFSQLTLRVGASKAVELVRRAAKKRL